MEFGTVDDLSQIQFQLPSIEARSFEWLAHRQPPENCELHIGAPIWGAKEWVGKVYPENTKPAEFLKAYSRVTSSVELNTTFYAIPAVDKVQKWVQETPAGFLFCPKLTKTLSHEKNLQHVEQELTLWFAALEAFGDRLGPCFLQLPPSFTAEMAPILENFFKLWPRRFPLTVEFRHPSCFLNQKLVSRFFDLLCKYDKGTVITDVAGRRDVCHMSVTGTDVIIRFIANSLHPSDNLRMQQWRERFFELRELGVKRIFFFLHQPENLTWPESFLQLKEILKEDLWTFAELPQQGQLSLI